MPEAPDTCTLEGGVVGDGLWAVTINLTQPDPEIFQNWQAPWVISDRR
jgi:hypothetical protein